MKGGRDLFHLLPDAFKGIKQIGVIGWGSQVNKVEIFFSNGRSTFYFCPIPEQRCEMKACYSEYTENGIFYFLFFKELSFLHSFCGAVVLREIPV